MPLYDRLNAMKLPELPPVDEGGALDTIVSVARRTGLPQVVGLTFEGLKRADAAFRSGILTARGVIPPDKFPQYWRDAWDGKLTDLSTSEFNKLFYGSALYEQAKAQPLIAGWTKEVLNAETQLVEERPVVSVGSVLDFASDVWASPLTYMMAGGPAAVKAIAKTPLWSPFRTIGRGVGVIDDYIFGTANKFPVLGNLMMHARELRHAFGRWPQVTKDFETTRDTMNKALLNWAPELHKIMFEDRRTLGLLKRTAHKYTSAEEKRVMNKLFGLGLQIGKPDLSPREAALLDTIMEKVGTPLVRRLQDMGYFKRAWSPNDLLHDLMPSLVNLRAIPADVLQSWNWKTLGWLGVPTYKSPKSKVLKKLQLNESHLDLSTSLRDLVYAAEKKLHWNARHREAVERTVTIGGRPRTPGTGFTPLEGGLRVGAGVAPAIAQRTITRPGYKWVYDGPLLKYAPRKTHLATKQNPHVADWSSGERSYMVRLINEIQGRGRGRVALELGELSRRMVFNLQDVAGRNRITKKLFSMTFEEAGAKLGVYAKPQYATQFFVHNVVRSMLWGNLGAAVKNTSQLLNVATVKGIPATIKGMFELSDPKRWALAETEVWHEFKKLLIDERWTARVGTRLDDLMMAPFNATENLARGTAFNVYLDDYMKKNRIPGFEALMKDPRRADAIRYAAHGAYDTNFIYGVLGRPASVIGSPFLRPLTTLLSYGPKQAEFYRRVAKEDGSVLLRAIGMHGLAIDLGNKWLGIAPESWLGWGFAPPMQSIDGIPLMTSPQLRWGIDIARGFGALGSGDEAEAARHFRSAQGATGQVLAAPTEFWQAYLQSPTAELGKAAIAAGPQLGLIPVPIVAIAKAVSIARMAKSFDPATGLGQQLSQTGETWVPITRGDIARSALFQTTVGRQRQQLSSMTRDAKSRVDRVLDERVRAYLTAAEDTNGDRLVEAARVLMSPIRISHGLLKQPPTTYTPMAEQIDSRLQRLIRGRVQSRDLTAMVDAGWLQDIYYAAYIDLVLRAEGLRDR
mgnify:CR=1 FL=1